MVIALIEQNLHREFSVKQMTNVVNRLSSRLRHPFKTETGLWLVQFVAYFLLLDDCISVLFQRVIQQQATCVGRLLGSKSKFSARACS